MLETVPGLFWPFVTLSVLVAAAFVAAVYWAGVRTGQPRPAARRSAAVAGVLTAAWMVLTLSAAAAGRLSFSAAPPTMLLLVAATLALALGLGASPLGARLAVGLPLPALVGAQGFRVGVELLLHRAYEAGLMPVQMSYAGRNFDIVTGASALGLGALLAVRRVPLAVVRAWNALGVALLANILAVALLSAPTPFRVFHNEPANVWVTRAPWVWLPTVLVLAAALGHVLVFRRLRGADGGEPGPAGA
jgi:hypothetical protein